MDKLVGHHYRKSPLTGRQVVELLASVPSKQRFYLVHEASEDGGNELPTAANMMIGCYSGHSRSRDFVQRPLHEGQRLDVVTELTGERILEMASHGVFLVHGTASRNAPWIRDGGLTVGKRQQLHWHLSSHPHMGKYHIGDKDAVWFTPKLPAFAEHIDQNPNGPPLNVQLMRNGVALSTAIPASLIEDFEWEQRPDVEAVPEELLVLTGGSQEIRVMDGKDQRIIHVDGDVERGNVLKIKDGEAIEVIDYKNGPIVIEDEEEVEGADEPARPSSSTTVTNTPESKVILALRQALASLDDNVVNAVPGINLVALIAAVLASPAEATSTGSSDRPRPTRAYKVPTIKDSIDVGGILKGIRNYLSPLITTECVCNCETVCYNEYQSCPASECESDMWWIIWTLAVATLFFGWCLFRKRYPPSGGGV